MNNINRTGRIYCLNSIKYILYQRYKVFWFHFCILRFLNDIYYYTLKVYQLVVWISKSAYPSYQLVNENQHLPPKLFLMILCPRLTDETDFFFCGSRSNVFLNQMLIWSVCYIPDTCIVVFHAHFGCVCLDCNVCWTILNKFRTRLFINNNNNYKNYNSNIIMKITTCGFFWLNLICWFRVRWRYPWAIDANFCMSLHFVYQCFWTVLKKCIYKTKYLSDSAYSIDMSSY